MTDPQEPACGYRDRWRAVAVWRGRPPIARFAEKVIELVHELDEQAAAIEKTAERN